MDDLTGTTLGDYELLRLLGRGAMAAVYLAEQKSLARRVAVKVLNADLARDAAYVDRFEHEARSAASLVHAHIVQVYEVGVDTGRHYLAQEYVPGGSLGQLIESDGALAPSRVLSILWQVAEALSEANSRGLVHRDIKPDNLMLDRSGAVKVADFGLARLTEAATPRLTREGLTLGTPLYMSPEQVEGREVDSRSDLYSLGVTAYHLLTGAPPFDGETALAVAVRHLNDTPEPMHKRRASLPDELVEVVERLMQKAPDQRFSSPSELLEALQVVAKQGELSGWFSPQGSSVRMLSAGLSAGLSNIDATRQLADAMQASSLIDSRRPGLRRRAVLLLGGLVVGMLLAGIFRPGSLLPSVDNITVRREATVKEQLFRAKLVNSPEAWLAVEEYFPEEDEYQLLLAQRGYVLSCFEDDQYRRTLSSLQRLSVRETDYPGLSSFAQAGFVVAHHALGNDQRAEEFLGAVDISEVPRSLMPYLRQAQQELNGSAR